MSLIDDIRHAQVIAGEDVVIKSLERQGLIPLQRNPQHQLLLRCLEVLSTLDGEDTTEQEMLDALMRDIKAEVGIEPLIPGSLI